MNRKWVFIVPAALVGIAVVAFIGGELVRVLWNWLLPPLFGWPRITFWQAIGLLGLCRILFGGFGRHGSSRPDSRIRHRLADRLADRMADRVAARWEQMSVEERERFRQRIRERCGFDPATGEGGAP